MSARPTSVDVLRVIANDETMRDAAHAAAVLALHDWTPHPGTAPAPNGWIGGRVRDVLPDWLDGALGTWDDVDVIGDPTGEIGAAFRPTRRGRIHGREALDALPDGAFIVDRDGYVLVKERFIVTGSDGRTRHGREYRTILNPDDPRVVAGESPGAVFDADEITGEYGDSSFLPAVAYTIGVSR